MQKAGLDRERLGNELADVAQARDDAQRQLDALGAQEASSHRRAADAAEHARAVQAELDARSQVTPQAEDTPHANGACTRDAHGTYGTC